MVMENKVYDFLKKFSWTILPISEFIAALGNIWGIPYCDKIVATLVAIHTVLGGILKVSNDNYNKKIEGE